MGWSSGENFRGETIGYGHSSVCFEDGCENKIHKGLAYTCGDLDGVDGDDGCGHHFCSEHLYYRLWEDESEDSEPEGIYTNQLCGVCLAQWEKDPSERSERLYA